MNKNNLLKVIAKGVDVSTQAHLFQLENISMTLLSSDYIEIEFHKNLNTLYIDLQTANTNQSILKIEAQNNGLTWDELDLIDETKGLSKSGFLFFEKNTAKKYRISLSADSSAMKITGIASQLCSDNDLRLEVPAVQQMLPRGYTTHIAAIESSTRYILQVLNNMGKYKYNGIDINKINRYDIFNVDEIRQCATYYSLHVLFNNASDSDDNYRFRADSYLVKFNESLKIFQGAFLVLDLDDNGQEDEQEIKKGTSTFKFVR
jgi:hypothetical protein